MARLAKPDFPVSRGADAQVWQLSTTGSHQARWLTAALVCFVTARLSPIAPLSSAPAALYEAATAPVAPLPGAFA